MAWRVLRRGGGRPTGKGGATIYRGTLRRRRFYGVWTLSFLLLVILGCHHRDTTAVPASEGKTVFERIAVAPFQRVLPENDREGVVKCPLCGTIFTADRTAGTPEKIIEALFLRQVEKNHKIIVMAGDRVAGIQQRVSATSVKIPLRQTLRELGRELGAEAVVIGYVYRFRERKGVSYAVEQPASVAFDLHLLRVDDGAIVWKGHYDRTQTSLMEDLLQVDSFIRQRGRWATAEDLAADGVAQIFKSFPSPP